MPQTSSEFVWVAFNGLVLLLLWFAKRDLGEIKTDIKENRKLQEANAIEIATMKASCVEKHRSIDDKVRALFKKTEGP